MAGAFAAAGFMVVGPREPADVFVINTCTVTSEADRKARQWLRSVRRRNPDSLVVAAGCGAERARNMLQPLADVLIHNREKAYMVTRVAEALRERGVMSLNTLSARGPASRNIGRTRSLVKVQEGCETPCAYCVVPLVRGREVSVPAEQVLDTVRDRVVSGSKEIVLTGTRIGAYRDGNTGLLRLVRSVLAMSGNVQLRLSSLQPQELSEELLSLWEDSRMCRHFHLSLQSGSDTVLERMGRGYSVETYLDAVTRIRARVPGAAITTDVIVGFPGETDQEFEVTVRRCEDIGFARMHVFPYSSRPGTRAAHMSDQVSPLLIRQRGRQMEYVGEECRRAYIRSWLGHDVSVVWEGETFPGSGVWEGTTDNYLRVLCRGRLNLHNKLERATIVCSSVEGLWVRRVDEDTGRCEAELEGARY